MSEIACHSDPRIADVYFSSSAMVFELADGRALSVPTTWYPVLDKATEHQRAEWEHRDDGLSVAWPLLLLRIGGDEVLGGVAAPVMLRPFSERKIGQPVRDAILEPDELFGTVYVISADAEARYKPSMGSAIRMEPPFGESVHVILSRDQWVRIKWSGLTGWVLREKLGRYPPVESDKPAKQERSSYPQAVRTSTPTIEVGTRGGVFRRTKSGFRRYF